MRVLHASVTVHAMLRTFGHSLAIQPRRRNPYIQSLHREQSESLANFASRLRFVGYIFPVADWDVFPCAMRANI